jgi:hypothetical protein
MSLASVTQALIYQLRKCLGEPFAKWESLHLAKHLFSGLEGGRRVEHDTIVVTSYNASNASRWKQHVENLSWHLEKESVDPKVPWLYNFKLDQTTPEETWQSWDHRGRLMPKGREKGAVICFSCLPNSPCDRLSFR